MIEPVKRKGLGRGLASLMDDIQPKTESAPRSADMEVAIDLVAPNPNQPRKQFDTAELDALTESIRAKGIVQPLIVRPDPRTAGRYQIVAGERRWRAAQQAQLHTVPVVIRTYSDLDVLEIGILENIQRADLNPLDEATAYNRLLLHFSRTQEQIASAMGKSRSHIANSLRLLSLPAPVQESLRRGEISAGHARAVITAPDPSALIREVVAKGLSVRETERLAQRAAAGPRRADAPRTAKDPDTAALEADLSAALGLGVSIRHKGQGGEIVLKYQDLDALDGLCTLLMRPR
jgi:ParB family chromosome partitioning protein